METGREVAISYTISKDVAPVHGPTGVRDGRAQVKSDGRFHHSSSGVFPGPVAADSRRESMQHLHQTIVRKERRE